MPEDDKLRAFRQFTHRLEKPIGGQDRRGGPTSEARSSGRLMQIRMRACACPPESDTAGR